MVFQETMNKRQEREKLERLLLVAEIENLKKELEYERKEKERLQLELENKMLKQLLQI